MINDMYKDFIVSLGTDILKEHGNEKYNEQTIKKELKKYIELQFSDYVKTDRDKEIDFESLYQYISKEFIEDFRECLYGKTIQREQKLDTIILCLCEKVSADTELKKEYVTNIVKNAYTIISYFYETKIIDSKSLYLANRIVEDVSGEVRNDLNKIGETITNDVTKEVKKLGETVEEIKGKIKNKEAVLSDTSLNQQILRHIETTIFYDIHKFVLEKFIKRSFKDGNNINYENYSDLFKVCVNVVNDNTKELEINNLFDFVKEKLNEDKEENKEENFINIIGPDGTGKSTFLSVLYMYLYEKFARAEIKNYPFYINLHYYDTVIMDSNGKGKKGKQIKELLKEDIEPLIDLSKKFEDGILIIIDGNERYARTTLKTGIILRELLSEIKGHKKIICIGEKTSVHNYKKREVAICLSEVTKYTFDFNSISVDDIENVNKFLTQFVITTKSSFAVDKILGYIEKFKLREIDYNLLAVLNQCYKKGSLGNVKNINDLYKKYCLLYFGGEKEYLETCGKLAYEYFMTRSDLDQKLITDHWKEWE